MIISYFMLYVNDFFVLITKKITEDSADNKVFRPRSVVFAVYPYKQFKNTQIKIYHAYHKSI